MAETERLSEEITAVIPVNTAFLIEPPPSNVVATLSVITAEGQGRCWRIQDGRTTIGRTNHAEIHLDDPGLSRRHAEVTYQGREFRVADLGSANGTFLNGSRVKEYALRHGDKLLVGETLLVFEVHVESVVPLDLHA